MKRTTIACLVAVLAVGAGIAAPAARSGGPDNLAVAVNTRDGTFMYRFAFKIVRANVDVSNAAVAVSSCTGCETAAVAFQVVLVPDDASVVSPENLALALNVDCTDCQTLASAYQYVLGGGDLHGVHFTAEGNQRLAQVRRDAEQLRHAGLTIFELQDRVAQLAAEVQDVVATQLVSPGSTGGSS